MPPTDRTEILAKFREQIENHVPIVGAGAGRSWNLLVCAPFDSDIEHPGIGLSAKSAEAGGIDLIIIYNSGRFRMAGRGSLAGLMPFSNANDVGMVTGKYDILNETWRSHLLHASVVNIRFEIDTC